MDCLRNYAREAIHGSGKMQLSCMTAECTSSFPESNLKFCSLLLISGVMFLMNSILTTASVSNNLV